MVSNLRRKEEDARAMAEALSSETLAAVREEVLGSSRERNDYLPPARLKLPAFVEAA